MFHINWIEVFEISDSITILRSGQNVYKCPAKEMTEEKFTYYMTGRNIDTTDVKEVKDFSKSDKVLEVKNLSAKGFEHVALIYMQAKSLVLPDSLVQAAPNSVLLYLECLNLRMEVLVFLEKRFI